MSLRASVYQTSLIMFCASLSLFFFLPKPHQVRLSDDFSVQVSTQHHVSIHMELAFVGAKKGNVQQVIGKKSSLVVIPCFRVTKMPFHKSMYT